ncbi:MAG: chorismate synthase [Anaerolineaceae bacterium]|nr:chorismate synthase [Anaerolineaceae bacterium]
MPIRFLTSGESHGPALVTIIEGLPAGLPLSENIIDWYLQRRQRGFGSGLRMKIENDRAQILSGVMDGITTGSPLSVLIKNNDHENWRGKEIEPFTRPRPGHADLNAAIKYGYRDLRPALERASARETAARVAAGAICCQMLSKFGIQIGGYVSSIGVVTARLDGISYADRISLAEDSEVRCPDPGSARAMREQIQQAMDLGDTLGGVIEVAALGLPPGLGSHVHWDRKLKARLGAAVLGIQAIKGVEIGPGFENAHKRGTQVQDGIYLEDGELVRHTNFSGGLEGGITSGQPLVVRAAMKPISTTLTPQHSVDLSTGEETQTNYERSDHCPVPRAVPVVEAAIAFVLADALLEKLGGDSMDELQTRFKALRKASLSDLPQDDRKHVFWPEDESEPGLGGNSMGGME